MSIFKESTMEVFYGDGSAVDEFECEVRFQGSEIIISYEDDDGHAIYRGVEEGVGHYRLTRNGGGGKATLHRFADEEDLDGYWIEDGAIGMWRITLGWKKRYSYSIVIAPRLPRMRRGVRIPDRSEITADTPLSLDVAARIAFPGGSMSGPALRNAATRGDLGHARLGGRVYTTLADIERMVAACWVKAEPRRSGRPGAPAETAEDEEAGAALAGALRVCEEMRQRFSKKKPK